MKIIRTDIADLAQNKKAFYKLTEEESTSVQDMTDEQLDSKYDMIAFLLYENTNSKGKVNEVLTIQTDKGLFTTISGTLKESFFKIVDLMGDEPYQIRFLKGVSKNGKEFVDCRMVCD